MCGIIAYKGSGSPVSIVEAGLKSLEYRGYDSWGICTLDKGKLNIIKNAGRIGACSKIEASCSDGIAIGHTRWATHGGVTQKNAHPHVSNDKSIAVAHNGIIENFRELKSLLSEKGFFFETETDTEVIPNLIQLYLSEGMDFKDSFRKAVLSIEGSYAVAAAMEGSSEIMFGKNGSPLVLGIGDGCYFAASDAPAFLEHTNKAVYIEDGDFGAIGSSLKLYDSEGNPKEAVPSEISWGIEQAKKGEYPHFMLKEIMEQKETIKKAAQQDPESISAAAEMIKNACGVFFVGCGTSYHACVTAAYEFAEIAKKHVNASLGSEFRNYEEFLTDKTLVVAVSQSGETADLLDAVKAARKKCAKVMSIVNVKGSSLERMSDCSIMMNAGPEICVLSTKSYTSQVAILLMLAYASAGKPDEGRRAVLEAASKTEEVITKNISTIKEVASRIKSSNSCFLIGRDLAYPSAVEGALKIKEVSYIHAEGFAGGELKHGTIALIEPGTPAVVFSTEKTRKLILSNACEIKSRGGLIIGIDSANDPVYDYFIESPEAGPANPLLEIIPVQLLSYYLAVEKGCDPDKPRNLAKSVTVK